MHVACSFSPRRIMLVGMMAQIAFGSLCGITQNFALHVLFRCLTAITCALMYSSGQMICKYRYNTTHRHTPNHIGSQMIETDILFKLKP